MAAKKKKNNTTIAHPFGDSTKNERLDESLAVDTETTDFDEEDLPIEEYIYQSSEEKEEDIKRFRELVSAKEENRTEEDAIELLYTAKRLFYNHHGLAAIEQSRRQMMTFWDLEVDDEAYSAELSGSGDEDRTQQIDHLLDNAYPLDELSTIKFNKLAQKHPEIPLFKLLHIEQMALTGKKEKSILNKLDEYCSEHPNNSLFQILNDKYLARNEKTGHIVRKELLSESTLAQLFKRNTIHSIEFYLMHSALFECLITSNDLLTMDALMHVTNLLFPHLEDLYSEKELYSEMLKVQFCKAELEIN